LLRVVVLGLSLKFEGRDIISVKDFSRKEIDYILKIAQAMEPGAHSRERLRHA